MLSAEELESRVNTAIEAVTGKGFKLSRITYGDRYGGCAMAALYVHESKNGHEMSPNFFMYGLCEHVDGLVGRAAHNAFTTGFDGRPCEDQENVAFYHVGYRVGKKWGVL